MAAVTHRRASTSVARALPPVNLPAAKKEVRYMDVDLHFNRICKVCGLTYGSHRGDSICPDQCPDHEGRMDWSKEHITTFVDSGIVDEIPCGTPRK